MKDLIQRLRRMNSTTGGNHACMSEAADALERLTAGDVVVLPEPDWASNSTIPGGARYYLEKTLIDYGNRRAAAAVLAEREPKLCCNNYKHCTEVCTLRGEMKEREKIATWYQSEGYLKPASFVAGIIRKGTP